MRYFCHRCEVYCISKHVGTRISHVRPTRGNLSEHRGYAKTYQNARRYHRRRNHDDKRLHGIARNAVEGVAKDYIHAFVPSEDALKHAAALSDATIFPSLIVMVFVP